MTVSRRLAISFLAGLLVMVAFASATRADTEPAPTPDPAPPCKGQAFRWFGSCWSRFEGPAFTAALNQHGTTATAFKKQHPELAAIFRQPWPAPDYERRIAKRLDSVLCRFGPMCGTGKAHARAGREWRVSPFYIAAISAVESTFAVQACGFNAWGIGACSIAFASWVEGIRYTTRLIRQGYIDRGLTDPYAIGRRYCPPCGDGHGGEAIAVLRQYFRSGPGVLFKDAVEAVK